MARPGEVITLQFGGYANWTGAHFWNFQVRRERERLRAVEASHSASLRLTRVVGTPDLATGRSITAACADTPSSLLPRTARDAS